MDSISDKAKIRHAAIAAEHLAYTVSLRRVCELFFRISNEVDRNANIAVLEELVHLVV